MAGLFGLKAVLFLLVEVVLFALGNNQPWIFVFGHAAILCGAVTATLCVRGFFLAAREREQKCFDTGREVGRAESSGVRDLHAIS